MAFAVAYFILPERISLSGNDLPNKYHYSVSGRHAGIPARIVAVAIDDYSHNRMAQRWPWNRSVYADLIRALDREGARTIVFDLVLKGSSSDPQDGLALAESLRQAKASVVLGYDFDFTSMAPGSMAPEITRDSYIPAMLNTLVDEDGFIRKLRIASRVNDRTYYSLSVMAVSAYLGKEPSAVASDLRMVVDTRFRRYMNFEDRYFYIDYQVKQHQQDSVVPVVSFYDVLYDMERLKAGRGADFLKDSIVFVYPAAEVGHDIHLTPLGKMPGGFVHINGIINILSGGTVDSPAYIPVILLCVALAALSLAVRTDNVQRSILIFTAVVGFNVFVPLVLWKFHIKADFVRVIAFSFVFFASAGIYRVVEFLARLSAIKDRATVDPLRGVYTLRYFRYRIELEARRRRLQAIMVHLRDFRAHTDEVPIDRLKEIWSRIHGLLANVNPCWASYSPEEAVGFSAQRKERLEGVLISLQESLTRLLREMGLGVEVKICATEYMKDSNPFDLFAALAKQARSLTANVLITPEIKLSGEKPDAGQPSMDQPQLLDSLAEDIEEKNRQLLSLYEKLKDEHGKTKEAFYQIITSLVNALEARDPYTQGHSRRVAEYALLIADKLGWPPDEKEKLRKASLLHDLGKIGIPDAILHKKGQLTDEEFGFIKQHEIFGVNILKPLKEIEDILPWILYHHEKWDGTGYPHGLGGDAIPIASQIIALADVYDALTTGRDYKKSLTRQEAVDIIVKGKGTHFSPQLADLFVSVI